MFRVKGRSALHGLTGFDVIDQDPVDYMHCVLLGVVRTLISFWFDSKYHIELWYIRVFVTFFLSSVRYKHSGINI